MTYSRLAASTASPIATNDSPGHSRAAFVYALREALRISGVVGPSGDVAAIGAAQPWPPRAGAGPGADWVLEYPPVYRHLLEEHGVPTVPYTAADEFNWALIEQLAPDCVDAGAINLAQAVALCRALGLQDGDEASPMRRSSTFERLAQACISTKVLGQGATRPIIT